MQKVLFILVLMGQAFANYAYVANSVGGTVSVIDTSNNIVLNTISVGGTPEYVAITPNGQYAYVTNSSHTVVSVINTATNAVMTVINIGTASLGIAITPDGKYAYVASYLLDGMYVIDTATYAIRSIPNIPLSYGIAITPDGGYAYQTSVSTGAPAFLAINTATDEVQLIEPANLSLYSLAIDPNGQYIYVTQDTSPGNVLVFDRFNNNALIATISVGANPHGIAVMPNVIHRAFGRPSNRRF